MNLNKTLKYVLKFLTVNFLIGIGVYLFATTEAKAYGNSVPNAEVGSIVFGFELSKERRDISEKHVLDSTAHGRLEGSIVAENRYSYDLLKVGYAFLDKAVAGIEFGNLVINHSVIGESTWNLTGISYRHGIVERNSGKFIGILATYRKGQFADGNIKGEMEELNIGVGLSYSIANWLFIYGNVINSTVSGEIKFENITVYTDFPKLTQKFGFHPLASGPLTYTFSEESSTGVAVGVDMVAMDGLNFNLEYHGVNQTGFSLGIEMSF